jgi:hypothetical protein
MPDMIVASTTATQEEMDHAVSANWRDPIPAKVEEKVATAEVETEEPVEEVAEEVIEETPVGSEEEPETASATETEEEQETTTEEQRPQKGKGGFQKKIDKLTREKGELAAQLLEFRERFTALEERLAGKPAAAVEEKPEAKLPASAKDKPTTDQIGTKFKDYEEYNEALIDWKAKELLKETLATRDKENEERETREIQEERDTGYRQSAKEFAEEVPDFNDAIVEAGKAGMKLPEPIIDLIKELPNGPAVTYYLCKNPDEALAIVEADPRMGFAMIGRISHGLEAQVSAPVKTPAKKPISGAPPQARPVSGHSARSSTPLSEMSTDEFIATRNKQEQERERRRYS